MPRCSITLIINRLGGQSNSLERQERSHLNGQADNLGRGEPQEHVKDRANRAMTGRSHLTLGMGSLIGLASLGGPMRTASERSGVKQGPYGGRVLPFRIRWNDRGVDLGRGRPSARIANLRNALYLNVPTRFFYTKRHRQFSMYLYYVDI